MTVDSLSNAVPRLAVAAAVLGFLYDAPHLLFDADYAVASDHPLYIFHGAAGIAAFVVLALVLAGLVLRVGARLAGPLPTIGGAVTLAGLFLASGGIWGEAFMIPYLADIDPSVFADDVGGYLLGIIVLGGVTLATGWMMMTVAIRRAGLASKGAAIALGVGSLLLLVPFPLTTFLFTLALAVVAQRLESAPAPVVERPLVATA